MARGTGATTRAMMAAPKGAVFVWCNDKTDYAIRLARKIGREDLRIVSPAWLEDRWHGLDPPGIVVDHAAQLTDRQLAATRALMRRVE